MIKVNEYQTLIDSQIINLENIVDNIVLSNIDLNTGIDQFANVLYTNVYTIFGRS
jgi:hypothetical protein